MLLLLLYQILDKNSQPLFLIDGKDPSRSNWQRYVNVARSPQDVNVKITQCRHRLYYYTFKPVSAGQELQVEYRRGDESKTRSRWTPFSWNRLVDGLWFLSIYLLFVFVDLAFHTCIFVLSAIDDVIYLLECCYFIVWFFCVVFLMFYCYLLLFSWFLGFVVVCFVVFCCCFGGLWVVCFGFDCVFVCLYCCCLFVCLYCCCFLFLFFVVVVLFFCCFLLLLFFMTHPLIYKSTLSLTNSYIHICSPHPIFPLFPLSVSFSLLFSPFYIPLTFSMYLFKYLIITASSLFV